MKILAISQNRADPTPWIDAESERTAALVAEGFVEQVFVKADYSGAVFIVESPDLESARNQLATLPLVQAGITEFTLTALVVPPEPPR